MEIKEIDVTNKKEINNIYIHDTYIEDINIDYNRNIISINLAESNKRYYNIIFQDIARFEYDKLSLCGKTNNQILEMYLDDYDIKQYITQKEINKNYKAMRNIDKLFTVGFLADNGDRISITCEKVLYMDLSKEDMKFIFKEDLEQNNQKIYFDSENQSFSCDQLNDSDFTVIIEYGKFGIDINLTNKQILQISGYYPKEVWKEIELTPPSNIKNGKIYIETDEIWRPGTSIDISYKRMIVNFDKEKNCVCIGDRKISESDINVRISSNLIVTLSEGRLKAIWIYPIEIK